MTMKSVDLPHLRSVVLAGHAGAGKTTLAEQLLFKAGAIPRLGRVDDGTAHLDFEPEEQKRRESLSLAVGTFESRRDADLAASTRPATRTSSPTSSRASPRPTARSSSWTPRAASRPASSTAVALGRSTGTRGLLLHQQVRPRERRPDRRPRRAAGQLRQQDRAAPARDRRGRDVRGLRRPRPSQGVAARDGKTEVEIPIPDDLADEVATAPRPAARGRRRGRRRRPDQVPRGRGDLRPRARGLPAQGRQGIDPRAGPRRQRGQGHRPARPARRDRPLPALPRRRAAGRGRPTRPARRSRSPPTRTARSSSASSRRPPTRSSAG